MILHSWTSTWAIPAGIDLARTLRRENPGIVIVFLTNFIQYAPEGFEVQAFRYLLKRDMNEKLIPYFEAASKEVVQRKRILTISVQFRTDRHSRKSHPLSGGQSAGHHRAPDP